MNENITRSNARVDPAQAPPFDSVADSADDIANSKLRSRFMIRFTAALSPLFVAGPAFAHAGHGAHIHAEAIVALVLAGVGAFALLRMRTTARARRDRRDR